MDTESVEKRESLKRSTEEMIPPPPRLSAGLRNNQEQALLEQKFKAKMEQYESQRAEELEAFVEEQHESALDELEQDERDIETQEEGAKKELERELENKASRAKD